MADACASHRRARRDPTPASEAVSPPPLYVQRRLPFFDPLDGEQIERLEGQVDWLIENIGIDSRDDPVALDIWRKAGEADLQAARLAPWRVCDV
jgi:trimethylamine--corrinoid protein Co-methyltransferase